MSLSSNPLDAWTEVQKLRPWLYQAQQVQPLQTHRGERAAADRDCHERGGNSPGPAYLIPVVHRPMTRQAATAERDAEEK